MAEYIIGDIHGHFSSLKALLKVINFNKKKDRLFFVGDLVNGGTQNVEVLDFIIGLDNNAVAILGNHDISSLAVYHGVRQKSKDSTIDDLLEHKNAKDYFLWLQNLGLIHSFGKKSVMVHAGIPAEWSIKDALKHAKRAEKRLRDDNPSQILKTIFEKGPNLWANCETRQQKIVYTIDALTRQRVVTKKGNLDFRFKRTLNEMPESFRPWFVHRAKKRKNSKKEQIFFGHWSALGLYRKGSVLCLDSGVRWGGPLTAIRLDDGTIFQSK